MVKDSPVKVMKGSAGNTGNHWRSRRWESSGSPGGEDSIY